MMSSNLTHGRDFLQEGTTRPTDITDSIVASTDLMSRVEISTGTGGGSNGGPELRSHSTGIHDIIVRGCNSPHSINEINQEPYQVASDLASDFYQNHEDDQASFHIDTTSTSDVGIRYGRLRPRNAPEEAIEFERNSEARNTGEVCRYRLILEEIPQGICVPDL